VNTDFRFEYLLGLSKDTTSNVLLAKAVLDRSLLAGSRLSESGRATEWSSKSRVLETNNADVVGTTSRSGAGHASWHLDLDGEVGGLSCGETANADSWHVLDDLGILEGSWVGASGSGIDLGGKRTGTVLVDLVEGHSDCTIIGGGWETGAGTSAGSFGDTLLLGALGSGGALRISALVGLGGTTTGEASEKVGELALVLAGAHEHGNGLVSGDWTTLGAAKSRSLAGSHLLGADDGGIGLGPAERRGAVTRSAISDRETWHVHAIGSLDLGNDTVGRDRGHEGSKNV